MKEENIKELEEKIAMIKQRIPPHSIPPKMLEELNELEEQLEKAKKEADKG